MRLKNVILLTIFLLPFISSAQDSVKIDINPRLSFTGSFDFEMGQIVKGRYREETLAATYDHLWLDNVCGGFNIRSQPLAWLDMRLGLEGRMWFNTFPISQTLFIWGAHDVYYSFYLTEAQGIFKIINNDNFSFNASFGYFPYKHNPEGRVFGDYLFRTGTYPVFILNKFDSPLARLGGLLLAAKYNNDLLGVRLDAMFLSEREIRPFHDLTIAAIAGFDIAKIVDFSAGISFAHLWPIDDSLTTPRKPDNAYVVGNDTSYYTFKGTKLAFRTTLDFFAPLREKSGIGDVFGKNGGKIYSELAIIGLKNYPGNNFTNPFGYDKVGERMPFMFGLTLPCWKILDVFAVELEYFNCPYPNSYKKVFQEGYPLPVIPLSAAYDSTTYKKNAWKWVVYAKRNFTDHIGIMFQVGRDNMRWEVNGAHGQNFDFEDILVKWDEWAWRFKTEFYF